VGQDIFFARGEFRPLARSGMHLLAHEVAHTLQSRALVHSEYARQRPFADNMLRRMGNTKFTFESEAAEVSATTYNEYGKISRGPGLLAEFIRGVKKYLGLTAAESLVAGSRIDIPFGGESYVFEANGDEQTKRAAFVAAFSSPKKLKQEIVVVGEGGGSTIEPLDVEIDSNYAGAVFDAAIQLVTTSSNVAVKAKTMDRAAWTTEAEGSEVINVDPQRIRNSYANEEVAASYDGFWILLHELFHRGPADVFKNLADAQNQTFLANNDTQASYRKRGPEGGLQTRKTGEATPTV
jgi:hypothetical protein